MKAKDYFDKYLPLIFGEKVTIIDAHVQAGALMLEFCDEVKTICAARHSDSDSTFIAVVNEMNDKWNCLVRLFDKNTHTRFLRIDGFKEFVNQQIKEKEKSNNGCGS